MIDYEDCLLAWKFALDSLQHRDITIYICREFLIPFLVDDRRRKRKTEEIGECWGICNRTEGSCRDERVIRFLSNCSETLVLDKRIHDHTEETLFNILLRVGFNTIPRSEIIFIFENALRVDYLPAIIFDYRNKFYIHFNGLKECMERFTHRLLVDWEYRAVIYKKYNEIVFFDIIRDSLKRNWEVIVIRVLILLPYKCDPQSPRWVGFLKRSESVLVEKYESYLKDFFVLQD